MQYSTLPFPYDKPYEQYTPKALAKILAIVLEQIPFRVRNISDYLRANTGVAILPESSDQELNRLPELIASVGRLGTLSNEEFKSTLVGVRPAALEALRVILPRDELDGETLAMVFDGALLYGESFRHRWQKAEWGVGRTPRRSIYYGRPVLLGIDPYRYEFCPIVDLHGFVGSRLKGSKTIGPLARSWMIAPIILNLLLIWNHEA